MFLRIKFFLSKILLGASLVIITSASMAQVTGDYRSKQTGNWNDFNSWEKYNGTAWVAALSGETPGASPASNVLINNSHSITFNATPANSILSLTIGSGSSGVLMFYNSPTAVILTISGIVKVNTGASFQSYNTPTSNGTHTLNVGGNFINNGTINFRITSAGITSAVNVIFTGVTANSFSGSGSSLFNGITQNNTNTVSGITISSNISLGGNLMINGSDILTLNGVTVSLFGALTAMQISGFLVDAGASSISLNGTAAQQLGGNDFSIANLIINNSSGVSFTGGGNITVNTLLTLTSGQLSIAGTNLILNGGISITGGTLAGTNTLSSITISEVSAGTASSLTLPTVSGGLKNLTITRSNGAILGAALTLGTNGILTLTRGNLTTTSTNILTLTNSVVTGASLSVTVTSPVGNSWVNGPMRRTHTFTSGAVYNFPVGNSSYNEFDVSFNANVTANNLTVQAIDGSSGGSAGTGMGGTLYNRYWSVTAGSSIAASGTVKIFDLANVYASSLIGYSSTVGGTYNSIGGTVSQHIVTSTTNSVTSPITNAFFEMNAAPVLTSTTYSLPGNVNVSTVNNLTQLATLLNSGTFVINGTAIFEFNSTYPATAEVFPITFNRFYGTGTVVIRPSSSVSTSLITQGDAGSGNSLITFNGTNNLQWDGVPGGSSGGSTIGNGRWIVRNTRTTATVGPTIQFNNDAYNNSLNFLQIEGQNISTNSGTVFFGSTATTTGNKYNTISYCSIRDRSDVTGLPVNAIFSLGNSSVNNFGNDFNIVSNCNIFNFFNAGLSSEGIHIGNYSSGWTIKYNSFYQTSNRTNTSAGLTNYAIRISNTITGDNYIISNNFIGGSASGATGSTWTQNGTVNSTFIGINLDGLTSSLNTIQNNIVANMSWTCNNNSVAVAPGIFCGIQSINGGVNILKNKIGGGTGTGSITITTLTSGAGSFGIAHTGSSGVITISNDTVGSVTLIGSVAINHSFTGISMSQGGAGNIRTISGNLIGSLTTANSINAISSSISATLNLQAVTGITITNSSNQLIISNNTVANLNNNYSGSGVGQVIGIEIPFMVISSTISGNTVRNLTTTSASTGTGSTASVVGISFTATAFNQFISHNHVYSLSNTNSSASTSVTGIFYRPLNGTGGTNYFDGNFVHTLMLSTTSASASINGIYIGNSGSNLGTTHFINNVVDLGLDASGNGINTGYSVIGINEIAGTDHFYFNSVYIGGGNGTTNSTSISSAFITTATANSSREISNNIFFNARTNNNASGFNYALRFTNLINTNSNFNDLYVTGTNGIIGYNGAANQNPLSIWTSTTSKDVNSVSSNPSFVNSGETVTATSIDLHIPDASTANKSGGILSNITTYDFDGLIRNSFSPIDMGAFAQQPSLLSVQLVSFTAELYNSSDAILQWATASEFNSNYFDIQVMDEITNNFRSLSLIKSSGTSVEEHLYNFIDEEENKHGIRYYRIKEVDEKGYASYSQIRKVIFQNNKFLIGEFFPNPVHDLSSLKIYSNEKKLLNLKIFSSDGKLLEQKQFNLNEEGNNLNLELSNYTQGYYTILLIDTKTGEIYSRRVLKI